MREVINIVGANNYTGSGVSPGYRAVETKANITGGYIIPGNI